jgi:telomerase reverse transcriptase
MPPGEGIRKQTRVSVTDSLKRRELIEEFIFWYFDSFLLPLLRVRLFNRDGDDLIDTFSPDNILHH